MRATHEEIRRAEQAIALAFDVNHIPRHAGASAMANVLIAVFIVARAEEDEAVVVAEMRRLAGRLTAMADARTPADMKTLAYELADSSTH